MFSKSRVTLLSTLLVSAPCLAREQSLFTSSVTYCEPPESLLVQQFDITYFNDNQTIFFNVSAASVEENVKVTASLLLNVYGIKPVNVTIDLCDILGGLLCPLPMYNFVGSDYISLASLGVDVSNRIPGIAFVIPDLEGYAQLQLTEVDTGDIKACIQATLSNGWSMYQIPVPWATAGGALLALFFAAWQSLSPMNLLPYRLVDLLLLYQTIASSAFLNLNYPVAFRAFALNFAWAMGLLHSTSMQRSIDNMRHRTGGRMPNSTDNAAVEFVNRKMSPYNEGPGPVRRALEARSNVATVTATSSNILDAGVPTYVNSINIASADAFMTVFLCLLIFFAIALAIFTLIYSALFVMGRLHPKQADHYTELRAKYPAFVRAWGLRLGLIVLSPILIFVFFQWTLDDSWVSILLAVVTLLIAAAGIGLAAFVVMREAHRKNSYALFSRPELLATYGPFYAQYLKHRYFYFLIPLVATVLRAIIISFGHASGITQVILLMVVELSVLASVLVLRPHLTRGADVFSSFLSTIRFVCTGLLIAFLPQLNVQPIPRVAIGIVMAVIFSVTVLIVIINLILHSGISQLWRRQDESAQKGVAKNSSNEDDALEKGREIPATGQDRPQNPTPEQRVPLDPEVIQPYPPVTPTTAGGTTSGHRDSASTNLGHILPRRWSFSPLSSPSSSSTRSSTVPDSSPSERH